MSKMAAKMATLQPEHFLWRTDGAIVVIQLNRPERMLPCIIGQGRAADALEREALAHAIAAGPAFANGITKTQLDQEWSMSVGRAIEAEAQAQAICMQAKDFERAYRAFVAKQKPVFEGD